MANSTTLKIPTKVVDSDWKDDIDYEEYKDEKTYISPNSIKKETIAKIKHSPIKLAIRNMVNLENINKQVAA